MKNILINNGWNNDNSYIKKINKKGFEGIYVYYNVIFRFSLTIQKSGKYALRGSVRVLSNNGGILKHKKKLFESSNLQSKQKDIKESIYSNSFDENDIKNLISQKVEKMYSKNYNRISEHIKFNVNNEEISPYQAFQIYGDEFINHAHNKSSQERRNKIKRTVSKCCSTLLSKPMQKFSKTEIKKWNKDNAIDKSPYKEMKDFWQFCIDEGICSGYNPFVVIKRSKRKSLEAEQANALKRKSLDSDEENNFYKTLESQPLIIATGVALFANYFNAKAVCEFKCKDIIIKNKRDNFVVIKIYNTNTSTATKICNRPLNPRVAKYVIKRIEALEEKYGKENIANLYLIHLDGKPNKKYSPERIIQEATRILQMSGIKHARIEEIRKDDKTFAVAKTLLHNTYKNNIYEKCNLKEDPGTAKFLLGESLGGDKTSDNYTSFTSPYGERRLFNILKALDEKHHLKNISEDVPNGNNITKIRKPKNTKQILQCEIAVELKPGEIIELYSPHGLYGEVKTSKRI